MPNNNSNIRIITDSASDISQEEARLLDIDVLPLKTIFADAEYQDGVELSPAAFYEKLIETNDSPSTSQVSPFLFDESFRCAREKGQEVLCLTLSTKLSGTNQSAHIAKEGLPEQDQRHIHIIDTENVTIGEQLLVRLAVQMRDAGKSVSEITSTIESHRKKVRVVGLLDTLEYLRRGGRISSGAALAGSLLSIKPVICIEEGEVKLIGKARGSKNGRNLLVEAINHYGGVDTGMPFRLAYSGLSSKLLEKYWNDNYKLYEGWQGKPPVTTIGAVIGTHVGPGAIAVAFFSKN